MGSDKYHRDFTDPRVRRPGQIDLELFQDIDACFDGHPGLQRAMKNWAQYWTKHYLHDGIMEQDLDVNNHNIINAHDCEIENNLDVGGDIVVDGTVDTIDVANHSHDGVGDDGERATGALIAWKQDYDSTHSTNSTSYVDTDALVTINLPEDSTVLITWKIKEIYMSGVIFGDLTGYLIINDGSDLSETEQVLHFINTNGDERDTQGMGGSYVKNYTNGSQTWKVRIKTAAAATGLWVTGIVISVMAFKQITES